MWFFRANSELRAGKVFPKVSITSLIMVQMFFWKIHDLYWQIRKFCVAALLRLLCLNRFPRGLIVELRPPGAQLKAHVLENLQRIRDVKFGTFHAFHIHFLAFTCKSEYFYLHFFENVLRKTIRWIAVFQSSFKISKFGESTEYLEGSVHFPRFSTCTLNSEFFTCVYTMWLKGKVCIEPGLYLIFLPCSKFVFWSRLRV